MSAARIRAAGLLCGLLAMGCGAQPGAQAVGTTPVSTSSSDVLERLADLELMLPDELLPASFAFERPLSADTVGGAALDLQRRLDALEPELRGLYAEADDLRGPTGEAVAAVTRGWLEVWQAAGLLSEAEAHDLAFPLASRTADGVSTAADDLRLQIETGIELLLSGANRHLTGYGALRDADEADAASQARFNSRADSAENFDRQLRPRLLALVSQRTTSVIAARERFETSAPGVEPRAGAIDIVCLDRQELARRGGAATPLVIEDTARATPDRWDCPSVPTRPGDD